MQQHNTMSHKAARIVRVCAGCMTTRNAARAAGALFFIVTTAADLHDAATLAGVI